MATITGNVQRIAQLILSNATSRISREAVSAAQNAKSTVAGPPMGVDTEEEEEEEEEKVCWAYIKENTTARTNCCCRLTE